MMFDVRTEVFRPVSPRGEKQKVHLFYITASLFLALSIPAVLR